MTVILLHVCVLHFILIWFLHMGNMHHAYEENTKVDGRP